MINRRFLFEADDDNTTSDANNTAANNDTAANDNNAESNDNAENNDQQQQDDNAENNDENQNQENEEDNQNDNNEDENNDDDFNDDDFTIGDGDNADNENNEDDNNDSSFGDDQPKADPDSLKAKDRELFDSLSIAEQQIKIRELKEQFAELYSNSVSLIDRFNEISMEVSNNSVQINKLISILLELKSMISFYILNIYDIKSYFENDIVFNRYLSIFNNIQKAIKTIKNEEFSDK